MSAVGDPRLAAPYPIVVVVTPETGSMTLALPLPLRHLAKYRSTAA